MDGFAIFAAIRDDSGQIIDFRYEYINAAGCRLNQRPREEHLGHTLLELLPGHQDAGLLAAYAAVVETGEPLTRESLSYEDVYGGGRRLARAFNFQAVKCGDGFAVTWRDVTALRQAEREQQLLLDEIELQMAELDATIESVADGLMIYDMEGNIVRMNPTAERMLAYTPAQRSLPFEERTRYLEVLTENGQPYPRDQMPNMLALHGESSHGVVLLFRNGQLERWLSTSAAPIRTAEGRMLGAVLTFTDITELKQAERALRETEETARALLDATSDAAFLTDTDGIILAANKAMALRMHLELGEIVGRNIVDLSPGELAEKRQAYGTHAVETGRRLEFEECHQGRWLQNSIAPILDAQGRVIRLAIFSRDVTTQKRAEEHLHHLAYYDHLTGLSNRIMFQQHLERVLAEHKESQHPAAILFLDLDRFKEVNDTLGHQRGDQLLQVVAQRLRRCLRESDIIARMGGDEFVILLPRLVNAREDAENAANRMQTVLASTIQLHDEQVNLSTSIGITLVPLDGTTPESLLKHADLAMYRAKNQGRNTFRFFADTREHGVFSERRLLEQALHHALERQELRLYYQPQCDAHSGEIVSMEALLRWCHPDLGMIPPLQFIPAAEETDLAEDIGAWVLQSACAQMAAWRAGGGFQGKLSVNISPSHFAHQTLVETIQRALITSGLPPAALEVELPERVLVRNTEHAQAIMAQLHNLGIRIAVADVGAGYSTMTYLPNLPLTTLKVNSTFMRDLVDDAESTSAVRAIIDMGHRQHLTVIAECVETPAQLDMLRQCNCDHYQGYLFSKPLPADECEKLLQKAPVG